jgi:hypothetical protein
MLIRLSGSSPGSGQLYSLQDIQPFSAGSLLYTPGEGNSVLTTLPAFQPLWINELQADNLTSITNRAGQHVPWIELYNPSANAVSLNGLYLATNYDNLTAWSFPAGASINPGEFKTIFADAQPNLSTAAEIHTTFTLPSGAGSLALSRIYNGQPQVLDYVDYTNIGVNHSYGSLPDGQSFVRQEFLIASAGNTNSVSLPSTYIPYNSPGAVYLQNFDSLPNPGPVSVNSANPVTINGVTYSLANPFGFADGVLPSGGTGGLGIPEMAGWYGQGILGSRFGATDGDQTTGGEISFGLPSSSNRALGLLATSSTGGTAFGAKFVNQTAETLNEVNIQITGELWRQSNLPKTLDCYYSVDPTGAAGFPTSATASLPALSVSFPVDSTAVGGVAVDGTAANHRKTLVASAHAVADWPPGGALWIVWQMTDSTGKAQGLGIDNFSFSAINSATGSQVPITFQTTRTNLTISWLGAVGESYQVEYKNDLSVTTWTALGNPIAGTGTALSFTDDFSQSKQRYYRLRIIP